MKISNLTTSINTKINRHHEDAIPEKNTRISRDDLSPLPEKHHTPLIRAGNYLPGTHELNRHL